VVPVHLSIFLPMYLVIFVLSNGLRPDLDQTSDPDSHQMLRVPQRWLHCSKTINFMMGLISFEAAAIGFLATT